MPTEWYGPGDDDGSWHTLSESEGEAESYTKGRFMLSWVDAEGARDPIALTSQVKAMRDGFERLSCRPALILVVVAGGEEDAAAERIKGVLDA